MNRSKTTRQSMQPAAAPAAEPTLLYAVKQVELAIRAQLERVLKPEGTTVAQYTALTVLRLRSDLSTADLARRSFVTAQTMGEIIVGLEKRGLVERRVDPGHGRRILTNLTTTGSALLERVDGAVASLEDHMVAKLTARQRDSLRTYLNVCRLALAGGYDADSANGDGTVE